MQGADGVVKLLAAFVVAAHAFAQHFHQPRITHLFELFVLGRHRQGFQGVEQATRIAIGIGNQSRLGIRVQGRHGVDGVGFVDDVRQINVRQRLQHIHRGP